MKKFSKILSVALLVALVLSLGVANAFAADGDQTLTITDARTGRTYVAYQILTGDISGTEGSAENPLTLANLKWGKGQTTHTAGTALTPDEINALPAANATRAQIDTYLDALTLTTVQGDIYTAVEGTGVYTFTVPAGWYVIKETTQTNGEDDFTSAFIVEVIGAATATPKGSKTTVEKNVVDVNDSDPNNATKNGTGKTADHDVGDEITFTLTATLGSDLTDYTSYELIFTDNLSKGLTYKELVSVTVDGAAKNNSVVTVADGSTYEALSTNSTPYEDGTIKTFTIANVLAEAVGAQAGSTIVITYTATLNDNAVIGAAGNPNKVYLEYSNNPGTNEHGKTTEDINIVFTYKVIVNKVDNQSNPLAGAEFALYKVSNSTSQPYTLPNGDATTQSAYVAEDANHIAEIAISKNDAGTIFTSSKGIDDGTYVLVETTTPTGFNTIAPIVFTVDATHTDKTLSLDNLIGAGVDFTTVTDATGVIGLSTDVVNQSGTVLPSTGGIGTTIFYVVGGVLVLAAIILLVTKKRMSE